VLSNTRFQSLPWDYTLHLFKETFSACFSLLGRIFDIEKADLIHGFTRCGKAVVSLKSGGFSESPLVTKMIAYTLQFKYPEFTYVDHFIIVNLFIT